MDRTRNRIEDLKNYIEKQGVVVNIAKNKARGNRGFYLVSSKCSRIDISKELNADAQLSTLLHEFAHFIHYKYDSKLESLGFVFGTLSEVEFDELLKITVDFIPKSFANSLFSQKTQLLQQNKLYLKEIKNNINDFKFTPKISSIEHSFEFPAKYFLKFDRFKIGNSVYDMKNIDVEFDYLSNIQKDYLHYISNRRCIRKINSKINRLNKYYNQTSELWARFLELFYLDCNKIMELAPNLVLKYQENIRKNKMVLELFEIDKILNVNISK